MMEFNSLSSDELIALYHKINAELTKQFLNRAPWDDQQERINNLSKISQELMRRKVELKEERDLSVGDRLAS